MVLVFQVRRLVFVFVFVFMFVFEGILFFREFQGLVFSFSFLFDDSSLVDSDDSIELEIRKFLVEKVKELVSSLEVQVEGFIVFGIGGLVRLEVLCRRELVLLFGVCIWSQRVRGVLYLVDGF